jgi:hypothetical protein
VTIDGQRLCMYRKLSVFCVFSTHSQGHS